MIGSLSRAIQQNSPPSEWIMCDHGVFPIFGENDLSKVDKILGLMSFFKARKDSKVSEQRFPIYFNWFFCSMECLQLLFIRVKEAVLWSKRFLRGNLLPYIRSLFMTNEMKANVCENYTFQIKNAKNSTGKRRLTSSNRSDMSALIASCEERHKKPFSLTWP